jgi:tRNA (guanine10-N2)-dimethyltransferase
MFVLSGEHPTLPVAEVCSAIRAEHHSYRILEQFDQALVLETKVGHEILSERLGMCREICWHICTAPPDELLEAVGSSDLMDIIPHSKSIAVEVRRVKRYSPKVNPLKLSGKIADAIRSEVEFKVDLEHPDVRILCVLTEGQAVVGQVASETGRTEFMERRPSKRAAFHPSTTPPVLARCMVNLARAPQGGTLFDPFCGVGGILIEAGLIGAKPVGSDIDPKQVEKARRNLEANGIEDFKLMIHDVRKLPSGLTVDAIATDPPFGRQASTSGLSLAELYSRALSSMFSVLREGGYLCISAPAELNLKEIAEERGFKFVEQHEQRVHQSLTRQIAVFKKEGARK